MFFVFYPDCVLPGEARMLPGVPGPSLQPYSVTELVAVGNRLWPTAESELTEYVRFALATPSPLLSFPGVGCDPCPD